MHLSWGTCLDNEVNFTVRPIFASSYTLNQRTVWWRLSYIGQILKLGHVRFMRVFYCLDIEMLKKDRILIFAWFRKYRVQNSIRIFSADNVLSARRCQKVVGWKPRAEWKSAKNGSHDKQSSNEKLILPLIARNFGRRSNCQNTFFVLGIWYHKSREATINTNKRVLLYHVK
jgi:hypothetical protein